MNLIAELKQKKTEMAAWRQHLHQFPEIAYEEMSIAYEPTIRRKDTCQKGANSIRAKHAEKDTL